MKLLNLTQLALELGRSRSYVRYMKKAGYVFEYGNRTTFDHALQWLSDNKEFRTTHVMESQTSAICD